MRRLAIVAAVMAMAGLLGGCGDDEEDAASPTTEATDVGRGATEEALTDYCTKTLKINTVGEPDIDFESATPEQIKVAVQKFATDLKPLAAEVQAAAPAAIKADIDVLVAKLNTVATTGDFAAFDEGPASASDDRVHAYEVDKCGWNKTPVTGVDYAFQGLPATLEAGPASFEFTNGGKEGHELQLLRINDDVPQPIAELLTLPRDQAEAKVTSVGGVEPQEPGKSDYLVADLKPGRYAAVCFLPVGGGEEGPPHFTQGMVASFEVKA
ncbi:MAG: hypothetical protein ACRDZW_08545 [Acidimicrobiales bacterium]